VTEKLDATDTEPGHVLVDATAVNVQVLGHDGPPRAVVSVELTDDDPPATAVIRLDAAESDDKEPTS
jgi:hypothetical protein